MELAKGKATTAAGQRGVVRALAVAGGAVGSVPGRVAGALAGRDRFTLTPEEGQTFRPSRMQRRQMKRLQANSAKDPDRSQDAPFAILPDQRRGILWGLLSLRDAPLGFYPDEFRDVSSDSRAREVHAVGRDNEASNAALIARHRSRQKGVEETYRAKFPERTHVD